MITCPKCNKEFPYNYLLLKHQNRKKRCCDKNDDNSDNSSNTSNDSKLSNSFNNHNDNINNFNNDDNNNTNKDIVNKDIVNNDDINNNTDINVYFDSDSDNSEYSEYSGEYSENNENKIKRLNNNAMSCLEIKTLATKRVNWDVYFKKYNSIYCLVLKNLFFTFNLSLIFYFHKLALHYFI